MGKFITFFKLLPKFHKITISILITFTLSIVFFFPSDKKIITPDSDNREYAINTRYSVTIPGKALLPIKEEVAPVTDSLTINSAPSIASRLPLKDKISPVNISHTVQEEFVVKKGDTLASLFKRAGLSAKEVHDISLLPLAKANLLKILPGEEIHISKNKQGHFFRLDYHLDPVNTLVIHKDNNAYSEAILSKNIEFTESFSSATIESNFWNAGIEAKLTPNQIMQLATIFGWDIDFALDLRKGDSFSILYEKQYTEGQFLKNGHILAAEFINQGERYTAIRHTDGEYYSHSGSSMRKDFLRSPVDFKYVSSRFNPRRLHPVTGQIKAHRGVDYVAAVGTPIKAAGTGRVIKSSYNKYNGNYVFIKHNDTYTTKYLHLKKRNVKTGQMVKQGDIIGTLGATGRITGPHLHYEFIVNGVHRNPRTIKLPQSKPINAKEKVQFLSRSKQLMAKLEENKQLHLAYKD